MKNIRRSLVGRVVIAGALAVSVLTFAPQASYASHRNPSLGVVARDYRFYGVPSRLPAGDYNMRLFNLGSEPHVLVAINLGPECSETIRTTDQAREFVDSIGPDDDPAAICPGSSFAGDVFAPPGGRSSGVLSLTPGRTLYFCPIPEEHGIPHSDLGMIGFIDVLSLPGGFAF